MATKKTTKKAAPGKTSNKPEENAVNMPTPPRASIYIRVAALEARVAKLEKSK